jgi:hypothetical protein
MKSISIKNFKLIVIIIIATLISIIIPIVFYGKLMGILIALSLIIVSLVVFYYFKYALANEFNKVFIGQLGNPNNTGFLPIKERLLKLELKKNPYRYKKALSSNSAVFYDRGYELESSLDILLNNKNMRNIYISGENHIGKTSFLNQLYQALSTKLNVISIFTDAKNLNFENEASFFAYLHQKICRILDVNVHRVYDSTGFKQFIKTYTLNYHFIIIIDNFDYIETQNKFSQNFFNSMYELSNNYEYSFSLVLTGYEPIYAILQTSEDYKLEFYSIFIQQTLGLLSEHDIKELILKPMVSSLEVDLDFKHGRGIKKITQEIKYYAGNHPFFVQILLHSYWNFYQNKLVVDDDKIKIILRKYYRDLWSSHSEEERKILLQIANNNIIKSSPNLIFLKQRGLVNEDNKLFSRYFEQIILEIVSVIYDSDILMSSIISQENERP